MAIADTINSIRTHLTADYESLENIGAELENADKNIENIASVVNGIYDNLPKTTGEDTSLSLTTLKGKMNIIPKGDTSQNGTPTPDTPIDIEVVTGTQDVVVQNANLLDMSKFEEHYTIDSNGLPAYNAGQTRLTNTTPINVEGIEKVTLTCTLNGKSFIYSLLDSNNTLISRVAGNPSGTTITIGEAKYLYICFYDNATLSTITDAMLVKGTSTTTPYTPHQEQTQIVSLGDIELCKIGNYQDYFYKSGDKWYKKENIGKYTFASSDNWVETDNQLQGCYTVYKSTPKKTTSNTYKPYCTNLIGVNNPNYGSQTTANSIGVSGDRFNVYIPSATTTTMCKSIMAEQKVYYVLATPNDIQITNSTLIEQLDNLEKLMSYNGTTNINSSGNLPMILNVSALKGE